MTGRRHAAAVPAIWGITGAIVAGDAALLFFDGTPAGVTAAAVVIIRWSLIIAIAFIATRLIASLDVELEIAEAAHRSTRTEIEQLEAHNAILEVFARSVDVPLAFQTLAARISRIVPCDRVGLTLLTEADDEFQTYTVRVNERDRRTRPRPEVVFRTEGTAIGAAVRLREPKIINDTAESAAEFIDVNVLHTSGFGSGMVIPLVAEERAVGTLNVVARATGAFQREHVDALRPVTELLALAHVAQQLQAAAARQRTMERVSQATAAVATDINNALQAIVGQCNVIERDHGHPALDRDIGTIVRQAQRIALLLEKMRQVAES